MKKKKRRKESYPSGMMDGFRSRAVWSERIDGWRHGKREMREGRQVDR